VDKILNEKLNQSKVEPVGVEWTFAVYVEYGQSAGVVEVAVA